MPLDGKIKADLCAEILTVAASYGKDSTVKLVLEMDEGCFTSPGQPRSAIEKAAANGRITTLRLLVKRAIDLGLPISEFRQEALRGAVSHNYYGTNHDVVRFLLAELPGEAEVDYTLLQWAGRYKNGSILQLLLGFEIPALSVENFASIHLAAENGDAQATRILLQHGACPNEPATWEIGGLDLLLMPLHHAARGGDPEVIRELLAAGAGLDSKSPKPARRIIFPLRTDPESEPMVSWTPLLFAVFFGHTDAFKALICAGADVAAMTLAGQTALHLAAVRGHDTIAAALLDLGLDITAQDRDGNSPLSEAVRHGHPDTVKLLISHGADINCRLDGDRTLLHHAARASRSEVATFLIDQGLDINARDARGETPLHHVCKFSPARDRMLVDILLDRGSDIGARDNDGKTPICTAFESKSDAFAVLLERGASLDDSVNN
jgi:ankyrin repeat protein